MKYANNSFGFNLKKYRIAKNLSQGELTVEINKRQEGNLSRNQLSNYENGVSFPSIPILLILSDVLAISCDLLLGKIEENITVSSNNALQENYEQLDLEEKVKVLEELNDHLTDEIKMLKQELASQKANVISIIDQLKKDLR